MRSFIFSFMAHLALLTMFMGATAVESNQAPLVQVQLLSEAKSTAAPTPVNFKKSRAQAVVPATPMAEQAAPAESSTINLQQNGVRSDEVFSYLVTLIYKNRIYPYDSIRLNQQGQVTVSFYINESGRITDIAVLEPCGHKQLNSAAVKTLEALKLNSEFPRVETLFKRHYSFTFDFEIIKS